MAARSYFLFATYIEIYDLYKSHQEIKALHIQSPIVYSGIALIAHVIPFLRKEISSNL